MPNSARRTYIGITGFTNHGQARAVLESMPSYTARQLMIGILASEKTLQGLPHKNHPNRYPQLEDIPNIPVDSPRAFNVIHYHAKKTATLFDQLAELTERCGGFLHGFQLNIPWPDPYALAAYRQHYPNRQFILQLGTKAFAEMRDDRKALAERVATEYDGLAEHVLLDLSGGEQELFLPSVMRSHIAALKEADVQMGIGIAGGISLITTGLVQCITKYHPDVNTDAEDGVHSDADIFHVDVAILLVQRLAYIFRNGGYV